MTDYILNTIFKKYDAVFYIAFFLNINRILIKKITNETFTIVLDRKKKNDTSVVVKRSV